MSVKAMSMQNLAVIYVGGNAYRVNFAFMSRNDAYSLIKNANIIDKKVCYNFLAHNFLNIIFLYNFFLYIKMSETTYYQRNRDIMLNRAKDYYENNKELFRERAKNKYRSLSEDEKDIKKQYQKARYHNMSDEEKQKLKDYPKNYREARKLKIINSNM